MTGNAGEAQADALPYGATLAEGMPSWGVRSAIVAVPGCAHARQRGVLTVRLCVHAFLRYLNRIEVLRIGLGRDG